MSVPFAVPVASRRLPLVALALSGVLWGTSAPLTKVALGVLDPGWLAVARFVLAGLPLAWVARRRLRAATSWPVLGWGAVGYGLVIALWNAGLARTSVTHGALMVGAVPALVAVVALLANRGTAGRRAWTGYAVAMAGVVLVAAGGGNASLSGDLLVLASMALSAVFTVAQVDLLAGRDPVAVTAVQLGSSTVVAVPLAAVLDGPLTLGGTSALDVPSVLAHGPGLLAVVALAVTGTLLPFTLFAWGQSRTTPEVAGAFLNLEPVVGSGMGALVFGDLFGPVQAVGALAVLGGIALSALPETERRAVARRRRNRPDHRNANVSTTAVTTARRTVSEGPARLAMPRRSRWLGSLFVGRDLGWGGHETPVRTTSAPATRTEGEAGAVAGAGAGMTDTGTGDRAVSSDDRPWSLTYCVHAVPSQKRCWCRPEGSGAQRPGVVLVNGRPPHACSAEIVPTARAGSA